jgi:TfoX/Sxy family transcriptional regulator of competence genes
MAYNQLLADRIREQIQELENIEEKEMFGGLCFLFNAKMFINVIDDEMMCRIDPAMYEEALEKPGCREMIFTGKPMKGWIMVDDSGLKTVQDFKYWIGLAADYNQYAKASKKKKK